MSNFDIRTDAKLGPLMRTLADILGGRWDIAGDLGTDIATLLTQLVHLANLVGTVSTGTFSLLNNVNEQDCLLFPATQQQVDIELDMINLANSITVREYVQVDGTNYRQISARVFPTAFDAGTKVVAISFVQKNSLYKITLQESVGEAKSIPFRYMTEPLS